MKTGLVSIIIPVRYRPDLLQVCLDILYKYTTVPFELIFVQEGDEPGVRECLNNYKHKTIVYHPEPQGYPKAINAGYREVSPDAEYVMFLNSDTVPTPGWLEEMVKCFDVDPKVAMVVPMLTAWNGIQAIDNANKMGDYIYVDEAVGVCMLLKKTVADELIENNEKMKVQGTGILDEMYEMGGGDDQDICMRLKLLGYKIINSRIAFIYHYISASFRKLFDEDIDYSKKYAVHVFSKFQEKFKEELRHKPNIFVAIPNRGTISNQLDNCLTMWTHDPRWTVKYYKPEGLYPVDSARNQCVKEFLEGYHDYLFFIDDDITPPINVLERLLLADKDIVGAICFVMKQDDAGLQAPFPVAVRKDIEGQWKSYVGKNLDWVDATGASCLLIKKKVLEVIERPFFFSYHKNGITSTGEDFNFCEQAKQKGFEVWVDFSIVCGHQKMLDIKTINDLMVKYGKDK